jgi:hypothetical protein
MTLSKKRWTLKDFANAASLFVLIVEIIIVILKN